MSVKVGSRIAQSYELVSLASQPSVAECRQDRPSASETYPTGYAHRSQLYESLVVTLIVDHVSDHSIRSRILVSDLRLQIQVSDHGFRS